MNDEEYFSIDFLQLDEVVYSIKGTSEEVK